MIRFETTFSTIESVKIVRLPRSASLKLPSRGMVMVKGTINGTPFQAALEPDGKGSHWFKTGKLPSGTLTIEMEPMNEWPDPPIPGDLKKMLAAAPTAQRTWNEITPMARWDWIRWINATKNPDTRKKRIDVACSKMKSGNRRPCCFDRSRCTDVTVSKNGVLMD